MSLPRRLLRLWLCNVIAQETTEAMVMLACTGGAPPLVARVRAPSSVPQLGYATGVQYPVEGCDNVNMSAFS